MFLIVLHILLLKKGEGFTNYGVFSLSLPCLLKIKYVTNGDIHFIAYFSCNISNTRDGVSSGYPNTEKRV